MSVEKMSVHDLVQWWCLDVVRVDEHEVGNEAEKQKELKRWKNLIDKDQSKMREIQGKVKELKKKWHDFTKQINSLLQ